MRDAMGDRALRGVRRKATPGWRLYRCMRALLSPADLCREGEEMRHCVGGYVPAVESGQCVILAIAVRVGAKVFRSTAELTRGRHVLQHRGMNNAEPPELCKRVLARFVTYRREDDEEDA